MTHVIVSPFAKKSLDFSRLKKIIIVRHDRIGDTVITLPLATLLKKQHPNLIIHFMLRPYTMPLALHHPCIDKVLSLPDNIHDKNIYQHTVNELRAEQYDLAILLPSKTLLAKLLWDAHIPLRLGVRSKLYSWRYNCWIPARAKNSLQHECDYTLDIIRDFVPIPPRAQIPFDLYYAPTAINTIKNYLAQNKISNYTIIHPGSGGSAIDLPITQYANLIASYHFPGTLMITGSAKEKNLYQQLAPYAQQPIVDATGIFNLDELMCLIAGCDLLLSNSTGPLHIARAFNRKLLGFYCTHTGYHPKRWGPYAQEKSHTFLPAGEHFETTQEDRVATIVGMQNIEITDIIKKLDTVLHGAVEKE